MREFWTAFSYIKKVFLPACLFNAGCVMVNSVAFYEWLPLLVVNARMDYICPLILGFFFIFFTLTVLYIKKVFLKEIHLIHSTLVSLMILLSKSHLMSYLCMCKIFHKKSHLHYEQCQFFSSFFYMCLLHYTILTAFRFEKNKYIFYQHDRFQCNCNNTAVHI